jgi:glycerophosphoryl diester phosphodiesterase
MLNKYVLSLLLISFLFSLIRMEADSSSSYPPDIITAHRGSSGTAPENTVSAVTKAIKDGADYAEIDVQQTFDGVVVLFHDDDLLKKTGISKSVWELHYEELMMADAGIWFHSAFAGESIPSLQSIMDIAKNKIKLNIELKTTPEQPSLVQSVVRLIEENHYTDRCIVTSFDPEAVHKVKQLNPAIRTGLIVGTDRLLDESIFQGNFDVLSIKGKYVDRSFVKQAVAHNKEVHAWTVNKPKEMKRLLNIGVHSIITDYPSKLRRIINHNP